MKNLIPVLLIAVFFGGGWMLGTSHHEPLESAVDGNEKSMKSSRSGGGGILDRLRLTQSGSTPADLVQVSSADKLVDPHARAALEQSLRQAPYSVLKQIFLERQDEQWARQQERYPQPKEMTDEEIGRRSDRLFDRFKHSSDGNSHYVSRGDFRLRDGKVIPYVALITYYSSLGGLSQGDATTAKSGSELCYMSTIYLRVGEKYAADGQSSCLSWVSVRQGQPFALHSNYNSKRLVPFFDTISLALPGFGSESDIDSEWYDAGSNRWTSLGKLRFDPLSNEEFASVAKETQLETGAD